MYVGCVISHAWPHLSAVGAPAVTRCASIRPRSQCGTLYDSISLADECAMNRRRGRDCQRTGARLRAIQLGDCNSYWCVAGAPSATRFVLCCVVSTAKVATPCSLWVE